ncbi:MAG: UDP-N-acetylmuramoyl-L-alanyl-D-glutamate--2,6-diaminopimelate ligase [Acidobacteria bacterium]|nr:UDP-N-acetylmuramoyl-L-alanyl-D-glutamate--2,6-diaminopimelate ligase [Acidobacteriota bacterium]
MKLNDFLDGIDPLSISGPAEPAVHSIAYNSREVKPGALFVAMHGEKTDGNRYAFDAVERGAVAIVSELPRPWTKDWASILAQPIAPREISDSITWIQVTDARKALAIISANFFRRPAETLKLIGLTGTNGKTTTTYLVDSILHAAGKKTGLLGTIQYRTPAGAHEAHNTTPESLDLQRFLAEVRDAGGSHATMEVSSHALAMDRVWGCPFAVAVFTNLTRDHLDFHKTFESYFAAKLKLFEGTGGGSPQCAVVNIDDPYGKKLVGYAGKTLTYSLHEGADIWPRGFTLRFSGLEFTAETPVGKIKVHSPLVGKINVYNILAAIGAGVGLGIPHDAIAAGIRQLENVPGRFQRIDEGQPFLVAVDYAHTDDALRNLIETAREISPKARIITLFGCGGDRDRTKRPLMGEIAGRLSHRVVLTSDNPRSEDPLLIMNDVIVGLQKVNANFVADADRTKATRIAIEEAREGDIVLLAGKGHETYQVLRDGPIDFDDREIARAVLHARGFKR